MGIFLEVGFTTPSYIFVFFNFIQPIVFWTFFTIYMIYKSGMFLLLAILVLEDFRIHVGSIDCSDMTSDIEAPVN